MSDVFGSIANPVMDILDIHRKDEAYLAAIFIEVAGTLNPSTAEGEVESGGVIQEDVIYSVQGSFTTAFTLIDPDSATLEHLEQVCEGGIPDFQRSD